MPDHAVPTVDNIGNARTAANGNGHQTAGDAIADRHGMGQPIGGFQGQVVDGGIAGQNFCLGGFGGAILHDDALCQADARFGRRTVDLGLGHGLDDCTIGILGRGNVA